jgi:hypothetical protein
MASQLKNAWDYLTTDRYISVLRHKINELRLVCLGGAIAEVQLV